MSTVNQKLGSAASEADSMVASPLGSAATLGFVGAAAGQFYGQPIGGIDPRFLIAGAGAAYGYLSPLSATMAPTGLCVAGGAVGYLFGPMLGVQPLYGGVIGLAGLYLLTMSRVASSSG